MQQLLILAGVLAIAKANFPDQPNLAATVLLYLLVSAVVGAAYMAWRRRHPAAHAWVAA